jgi:prepilin-type N-terminal cleavage/methylation domain-containing protein
LVLGKEVRMSKVCKFWGKRGFTLVELMVVVAIISLLAAIAIPNFLIAREKVQKTACIANLKQIDGAITLYALDENLTSSAPVALEDLIPRYIKSTPSCPAGGNYMLVDVKTTPTCTIAGHELP